MFEVTAVNPPSMRVIRPSEARDRVGVSRAKFADMVAKGQFPKPFTIIPGGRAVGWLERDVDAWIMDRCASTQEAV
ncbi:MAG: AlpA family phage regulatory protein [Sphingobium sp.]|nr:MAG: AlpA family phage regulatory protein [Sphingobium sp.]